MDAYRFFQGHVLLDRSLQPRPQSLLLGPRLCQLSAVFRQQGASLAEGSQKLVLVRLRTYRYSDKW